jgi:hypothetical protein
VHPKRDILIPLDSTAANGLMARPCCPTTQIAWPPTTPWALPPLGWGLEERCVEGEDSMASLMWNLYIIYICKYIYIMYIYIFRYNYIYTYM